MTLPRALRPRLTSVALALSATVGCGGSSGGEPSPTLEIVTASGAPLHAYAGDGIALKVVARWSDGSAHALPSGASVTWTSPATLAALPPGSTASSAFPVFTSEPTVAWIDNPSRPDRAGDLANVLFVLDPGTDQNATAKVSATVTGTSLAGEVSAELAIDPAPEGVASRGSGLFGSAGAGCSACHGASGEGSAGSPGAMDYSIDGASYPFPAPGIDAEPGNLANDPTWTAALLAVSARADVDNDGVALRAPMPDWLTQPNPATGAPLTTQDFADIYAFLKTQTQ